MKKFIIKKLSSLIPKAQPCINKHKNNPISNFDALTPLDNCNQEQYNKALIWALKSENEDIKNIALAGAFGSGKSSIILTFQKNHPEYRYLNISLATLNGISNKLDNSLSRLLNFPNEMTEEQDQNQLIELSILQQMFYQVKGAKIPLSRYKRINSLSKEKRWLFNLCGLIVVFPCLYAFGSTTICNILTVHSTIIWKFLWILVLLVFIAFFLLVFNKIIDFSINLSVNKFTIKDVGFELDCKKECASILNKYLDEILYLFERARYNVVVLEDIDRFDDSQIFIKLREINYLINHATPKKPRVVFIYAIRDDMFSDKDRTKFFDFIIPVIPIINVSNSGDAFINKLKQADQIGTDTKKKLSADFVNDVAIFINDMRLLKNILNEFLIYDGIIGENLIKNKLLAMIVYKNLYPSDFVELHNNSGIVYQIINGKNKLIKKKIEKIDQNILEKREKIEKIGNERLQNAKELRILYVNCLRDIYPKIKYILTGTGKKCDIKDLIENEKLFNEFYNRSIMYYWDSDDDYKQGPINFSDIEKKIGYEFNDRLEIIEGKINNETETLNAKIEKLNTEKREIQNYNLKTIIGSLNTDEIVASFPDIKGKKLIFYLLRYGYIEEDYFYYISFFYEGNITPTDREFVISIKSREQKPFDFKLQEIKNIISSIRLEEYSNPEILNFDLLNYLIDHRGQKGPLYQSIIKQLSNKGKTSIDFIDQFIEKNHNISPFIESLSSQWKEFWKFILYESKYSQEKKNQYFKIIINCLDVKEIESLNIDSSFSQYMAQEIGYKALITIPLDKAKEIIKTLKIRFNKLSIYSEIKEARLYSFIIQNNYYEINIHNLSLILCSKYTSVKDLITPNYTAILNFSDDENLLNYIDDNITDYLNNVYFQLDGREDEGSVARLLNGEQISFEDKTKIIKHSKFSISYIEMMDDKLIWPTLIQECKIAPTWSNLILYYSNSNNNPSSLNQELINFLNITKNSDELSKKQITAYSGIATDNIIKQFAQNIIFCKELTINSFQSLILSIPKEWMPSTFEIIEEDKVALLISNSFIKLTAANFLLLRRKFPNLLIGLLEQNKTNFIETLDTYELNIEDIRKILFSDKFTDEEKIQIINKIDANLFEDSELCSLIGDILEKQKDISLNINVCMYIAKNAEKIEHKISAIIVGINNGINNKEITDMLLSIDEPYSLIPRKGAKLKIPLSSLSVELVEHLKGNRYISNYSCGKDFIRITRQPNADFYKKRIQKKTLF